FVAVLSIEDSVSCARGGRSRGGVPNFHLTSGQAVWFTLQAQHMVSFTNAIGPLETRRPGWKVRTSGRRLALVVAFATLQISLLAGTAPAAPAVSSTIDFNRDIRPIFSENCYACHGPDKDKRKAGLRLD